MFDTFVLVGLKAESTYDISLMSFNDEGSSSYHGPVTVTTEGKILYSTEHSCSI